MAAEICTDATQLVQPGRTLVTRAVRADERVVGFDDGAGASEWMAHALGLISCPSLLPVSRLLYTTGWPRKKYVARLAHASAHVGLCLWRYCNASAVMVSLPPNRQAQKSASAPRLSEPGARGENVGDIGGGDACDQTGVEAEVEQEREQMLNTRDAAPDFEEVGVGLHRGRRG